MRTSQPVASDTSINASSLAVHAIANWSASPLQLCYAVQGWYAVSWSPWSTMVVSFSREFRLKGPLAFPFFLSSQIDSLRAHNHSVPVTKGICKVLHPVQGVRCPVLMWSLYMNLSWHSLLC